ncbi:cation diffusion facilitator CzcD-associated flavoprotein CzcO [Bradyrhizobium diazoefficiens]
MRDGKMVAIVGAGPVGLAAAAHVLARGMSPVVLEAGPEAGHAIRQWQHVQLFSPWEYNIDKAAARLLAPTGWNSPDPQSYPTGGELLDRYLAPLATRTPLREAIRTSSRVSAISRVGFDKARTRGREQAPFEIRYRNGSGPEVLRADAVIDTSGTWFSPNPAGSNGLPAIGEPECAGRVAYSMPDVRGAARSRYAGKTVAVLGAGHSAVGTLIDLVHLAGEVPGT